MRRPTAKPLSSLLQAVLKPAFEQHGLATSQVILRWREIAGEDFARVTRPLRVNWPRALEPDSRHAHGGTAQGRAASGTLVLLVEPAFALDMQHEAPHILARVNALYGWNAIAKITLKQGPVAQEKTAPAVPQPTFPAPSLPQVEDENLRHALQKWAQNVPKTSK